MPDLVKVANEHAEAGLDVLLVSYDLQVPKVDPTKARERVERFVNARRWGVDVALIAAADIDAFHERYGLPGPIPVTLAFDKQGRLVERHEGECDQARFRELAKAALAN
jgi:hypothetical protein